jgi:hypothetical protein
VRKQRALQKTRGILPEVEKKEGWHLPDAVIQSSSFMRMMVTVSSM